MQAEFRTAAASTRSVLEPLLAQQSSSADDPNLVPHILKAMAGDRLVTFSRGDKKDGTALHLLHVLSEDLPEERSEWDMTLSALPSWCPVASADEWLASARLVEEARTRIARSLGVAREKVRITDIKEGSVHVRFTVGGLTLQEKETILSSDVTGKLQGHFDTFNSLEMSPAILGLHFNLSDLDSQGHKRSSEFCSEFEVGPPSKTRTYYQPSGWTRYGFKVLGAYGEDTWLRPFQHQGNWYCAFHGTSNSGSSSRDAVKSIVYGGFRASRGGKLGPGVYASPLVQYVEGAYCPTLQLELSPGKTQQFKFVLQVAVKPDGIMREGYPNNAGTNQEWTAQAQDVRPYGLLVKEV